MGIRTGGLKARSGFVPAKLSIHEDDPGPTEKAYYFARSLSMADGRAAP